MPAVPSRLRGAIPGLSGDTRLDLLLASALLFAFPLFVVSVAHWASGIYAALALLGLVALRRPDPPLSPPERWFIGIILAYLAIGAVSNTLSGWTNASIRWYEADARFLLAIPLYLMLRTRPDVVLGLFRGVPVAALVAGAYVIHATAFGAGRVDGPYGPIFAGNITALLAIMSLATIGLPTFAVRVRLPLHLLGFCAGLVGVVLSGTRSAWLAIAVALPIALFYVLRDTRVPAARYLFLAGAVALCAIVLVVSVTLEPKLTTHRLTLAIEQAERYLGAESAQEREEAVRSSVGLRFEQWRAGLMIFSDHPFFGVGVGNINAEVNRRVAAGEVSGALEKPPEEEGRPAHMHSALMDALVFKGVSGLAALLVLLLYPAVLALRRGDRTGGVQAVLVLQATMFLVFSLTEDPFIRNNFTSVYLVFLVAGMALLRGESAPHGERSPGVGAGGAPR